MSVDQDGVEVEPCHYHPDQPAIGADLYGTQLCDGCAVSSDRRDDEQREWDS